MYVCYADESGHCGRTFDRNQPVEVICGVQTNVTKLFKTQRELAFLVRFLSKLGIPLDELKASDIYGGRRHWSSVSHRIRKALFDHILKWAADRSCVYYVCPIDSNLFFSRQAAGCQFASLLKTPFTAASVNLTLSIQRAQASKKNNKGKTLLIFDAQGGFESEFLTILGGDLSFTDGYAGFAPKPKQKHPPQRLHEIVDVPHFSRSHLSVLIQVADIAAFIVNKYLSLRVYGRSEAYSDELSVIGKWYELIGERRITHTMVNPSKSDPLCDFYREVRPQSWTSKEWLVA